MRMIPRSKVGASLLVAVCASLCGTEAGAAVIPGEILARTGESLGGLPAVTSLHGPTVDGSAGPAFYGMVNGTEDLFIWKDGAVIWDGRDHGEESRAYSSIRVGPGSTFVGVLGIDDGPGQLWTESGSVLDPLVATPGVGVHDPELSVWSAKVGTDGSIYWQYQRATQLHYVMRTLTGDPADAEVVFERGAPLGPGLMIPDSSGAIRSYEVSPNGQHVMADLRIEGDNSPSGTIRHLWVDGAIAPPTSPRIFVANDFAVDDAGHYAVAARLVGGDPNEAFVVDSQIAITEGDSVAGYTIEEGTDIVAVGLDGNGHAAHIWDEGQDEAVLVTCDFSDPMGSTRKLLYTGDEIDVDGDQIGDFTVDWFAGSFVSSTHFFGSDGRILLPVDGGDETVTLRLGPVCCTGAECCGNGVIDAAEQCDDGDPDGTDDCTTNCTTPVCGDGFVHAATEECDDGNDDDDDACSNACVAAEEPGSSGTDTGSDESGGDETAGATSGETDSTTGGETSEGESSANGSTESGDDESGGGTSNGSTTGSSAGSGSVGGEDTDGGTSDTDDPGADDAGGCGCTASPHPAPQLLALTGLLLLGLRRRRRA